MKKVLSTLLFTTGTILLFGQAQNIVSENFETLNLGNVGTSVAGATPGQNNWYTLGGSNSDFQITNIDTAHGKSMTINSYNSYDATANSTLNSRIAAQLTTVTATASNNITYGKFDLYTGASTGTGTIQMRVLGKNGTADAVIGGFTYNVATKELRGLGTFTNMSTGVPTTYSIGLAAAPGIVLTANTWITLSFQYNKTTGAIQYTWPTGSGGYSASTATLGLIPGMVAQDVYLYNVTDTGNTVSKTAGFDNILVQFTNTTILSTNELSANNIKAITFIYPNPTSDFLNIKTDSKINAVSVVDLSGRKMEATLNDNKVDVRNIPKGTYIINIETKEGKTSEKFIKQ